MNEFIKKFRFITLICLICTALSAGVSAAFLYNGNLLRNANGGFNITGILSSVIFFFVLFMLFSNITLSHRFATGRIQEILFFTSSGLAISAILAYVFYAMIDCNFEFAVIDWYGSLKKIILAHDLVYYANVVLCLIVFTVIYGIFIDRKILGFFTNGGNRDGKAKQVVGGLENSRWMSKEEKKKNFKFHTYTKLGEAKKDGIPVAGRLIDGGRNLEVAFNSPCHALVIGSTGSGKTTTFVSPMIQLLATTSAGSSMIITDPKGELFNLHSKYLKSRGYDVKVIDLRDTYSSYRWNPLDSIYDGYEKYRNAHKLAVRHHAEDARNGLTLTAPEAEFVASDCWYEFDGKAYADYAQLVVAIKVYKKKLFDEVYEDLNDLVSVLIPVENEKDPMWEKGARSIVLATLLAMLEDSADEELGMTKEKFNFFNLSKILQNSSDDYRELRGYFAGRSPLSRAASLSKQVCDAATQTRASYMSIVYEKLTLFNDAGICSLTAVSDFTAADLAERPTALFLKIPDEKDTRHNLAAIFILNIYKTLIKIASATAELSLPRNVYFIMDEFGNMPKIEKFDKFITVGRSRKIWFTMIIQSYAQLNNVYGESVADIVKGNCGVKMFIGSNDMETCKEFSELCGNITVSMTSTSTNSQGDTSYSNNTQVRPLIYPSELQRLNHPGDIGHSIIVTFGNYPLKTYFSPSFQVPFYKMGKMDLSETAEHFFDENAMFYDIRVRNNKLNAPAEKQQDVPVAAQQAETDINENDQPTAQEEIESREEEQVFPEEEKAILEMFRNWKLSHPGGTVSEFLDSLANRKEVSNV
ncbi:MAG: type IV secretory system conjugative DNA transfer family protein [Clostridia bacterium]|nr:type IV secretory system conjugative DNA transfer family protein [Clostridia bacterium]